jgi:hypothetical protein
MTARRRTATLREGGHVLPKVSAEARAAYAAGDVLGLHRALGLKPWEASPLDTSQPYSERTAFAESWPRSRAIRTELER